MLRITMMSILVLAANVAAQEPMGSSVATMPAVSASSAVAPPSSASIAPSAMTAASGSPAPSATSAPLVSVKAPARTSACTDDTTLPQPDKDGSSGGWRGTLLRVGRVSLESVLGLGLGAGVGVFGAYAGLNVDLAGGHESGAGLSTGLALGTMLGVGTGVWLGGWAMAGDGSFGWTMLGSAVGTGISTGLLAITDKPAMLVVAAAVPIAGAVLGYELSSHDWKRAAKARRESSAAPRRMLMPVVGPSSIGLIGIF